jgi:hypothetical protein
LVDSSSQNTSQTALLSDNKNNTTKTPAISIKKFIDNDSTQVVELNLTRKDLDSMIDTVEKFLRSKYNTFSKSNSSLAIEDKKQNRPTYCRKVRRLLYSLSLYYLAAKSVATDSNMSTMPQSLELSVIFNCLVKYKTQFQKLIMQLKGGIFSMGKIPCKSLESDLMNPISFVRYSIAYNIFQSSSISRIFKLYGLSEKEPLNILELSTDLNASFETNNGPVSHLKHLIKDNSFDRSIGNI